MIKLVTSDHNFVLSDQDGVLVGHMSFQVKKLFAALQMHEDQPFQQLLVSWKRLYLPLNRM